MWIVFSKKTGLFRVFDARLGIKAFFLNHLRAPDHDPFCQEGYRLISRMIVEVGHHAEASDAVTIFGDEVERCLKGDLLTVDFDSVRLFTAASLTKWSNLSKLTFLRASMHELPVPESGFDAVFRYSAIVYVGMDMAWPCAKISGCSSRAVNSL